MELATRRGLALTFTLLFVVIAPASVAYGRGYRIDYTHHRIRLTGVIAISGFPKRVRVSLDGQPTRATTLPMTARGVLPGDHTLRLTAPGYGMQDFTVTVRPGENIFLNHLQLIRENAPKTIRTGIPNDAQLAPLGNAVAWVSKDRVFLATPTGAPHVSAILGAKKILWADDGSGLEVRGLNDAYLGSLRSNGERLTTRQDVASVQKNLQLRTGIALHMVTVQRIPDGTGWFYTGAGSAWVLVDGTDVPKLFTRWYEPITSIVHLGRDVTATVRADGITIRNELNEQVVRLNLAATIAAVGSATPGTLHILVRDGDLLQWQEISFF